MSSKGYLLNCTLLDSWLPQGLKSQSSACCRGVFFPKNLHLFHAHWLACSANRTLFSSPTLACRPFSLQLNIARLPAP